MLPLSWVDRIFARLQGIYGTQFTSKFSTGQVNGVDLGFENAKQVWADELAGFADMPEAISYALKNVDDKFPPSAREFLALCRRAPRRDMPSLPHKQTPEEAEHSRQMAEQARAATSNFGCRDSLLWAKRPGSKLAFSEILKLSGKDERFREIVSNLTKEGVTDGHRLLKQWDGQDWVRA